MCNADVKELSPPPRTAFFAFMASGLLIGVHVERLTYFLITRKLFESAIWRDDPHLLKLFIYLIGMARHQKAPKKFPGFEIGRGELVTSLAQIADDCEYKEGKAVRRWGRMKVSRLLHRLEVYGYIELLRYSYGTCIKICNYDKYQSQTTYKNDDSVTMLLRPCYDDVTKVLPYNKGNKGNNVKNEKIPPYIPPCGSDLKSDGHDWIDPESWDCFLEHRISIKKPLSNRAVKIALKLLENNSGDQKQIIDNSILNNWTGLFELKNKKSDGGWDELRKEFCKDDTI